MNIVDKINKDLGRLPIKEKLDYWFNKIYPELINENGCEDISFAMRYFDSNDLIECEIGIIPWSIFEKHFQSFHKNRDYMNYIADREARMYFIRVKQSFLEDFEMYGNGYLKRKLNESVEKLKTISNSESVNEEGKSSIESIFLKNYLIPFFKKQLAKFQFLEFKSLDDIVNEKDKEFLLNALESLKITKDNKSILTFREKSKLRGAVEAFMERGILPNRKIDNLIELLAEQIKMPMNARLKETNLSKEIKRKTIIHIRNNYKQ